MALQFGAKGEAASVVRPTKTQLQCSNCGKISEWKEIKENAYLQVQGGVSIQTHEFAPGRWMACCPNPMCAMVYMAGGKPMVIEGVDLMRLEGESDEAIREFMTFKAQEQQYRDKKYQNYLKGVKDESRPAPKV